MELKYTRGEGVSPLNMEIAKLLNVIRGDRMTMRDKHLSIIRSEEERDDWEEALGELEKYLMGYNRNKIIIANYDRMRTKKSKERGTRTKGESERGER